MNEVKVKLVSWTERPVETMMWAFMNMHKAIPDSIDEFVSQMIKKHSLNRDRADNWESIREQFIVMLSKNPHSSVLEFVNTVWLIDGCSRAFQQQLTRTRLAAYSIQSLRIVDTSNFADNGSYHVSSAVEGRKKVGDIYKKAMLSAQESYREMIACGAKAEDARGVLPLNVSSPITMAINLRAIVNMIDSRLCYLAQEEFRRVAVMMIEELQAKIHMVMARLFSRPCDKKGVCPMAVCCGKTKYTRDEGYDGLSTKEWLA